MDARLKNLVILTCSPRLDGNCDTAANLVAKSAIDSGLQVKTLFLREYTVRPCCACGHCTERGECPLDQTDDAGVLFQNIQTADVLLVIAPIYFYGPPAHLKTLIDRSQRFWAQSSAKSHAQSQTTFQNQKGRPAQIILCAGRTKGERLFDASLLILRCFLRTLDRCPTSPLLIRGVDARHDLINKPDLVQQVFAVGRESAELAKNSVLQC